MVPPPGRAASARAGGCPALGFLGLALGLATMSGPAAAYIQLIPQIDAGATYEDNPRFFYDFQKAAQETLSPGSTDSVLGLYTDLRLEGHWNTPASQVTLTPRLRRTDYLKANDDLNDDDKYLDLSAVHSGARGNVQLTGYYREVSVRTSEFLEATPDDPDAPLDPSTGSGHFADRTQKTWSIAPALAYQLSPRNVVNLSASYADVTYDEDDGDPLTRSYLDYDYSSVDLSLRHILDAKNAFSIGLNRSHSLAHVTGNPFRNSSDSYGVTVVYERNFSQRLSGNISAGTTRNSATVSGIVGGFDPVSSAFCFPFSPCEIHSEEENIVGGMGLRWRTQLSTLNLDLSRNIAPRSDGTEVVQDQLRFFIDRTLTRRLSGTFAIAALKESAVGKFFEPSSQIIQLVRQDRTYVTADLGANWRLTPTLSVYGRYSYRTDRQDVTGGSADRDNNRLFFGVKYRGVGLRR